MFLYSETNKNLLPMFKVRKGKLHFSMRRVFILLLEHFTSTFLPTEFSFLFLQKKLKRALLRTS